MLPLRVPNVSEKHVEAEVARQEITRACGCAFENPAVIEPVNVSQKANTLVGIPLVP